MSEILLCDKALNAQVLKEQCGVAIEQVSSLSCTKPSRIAANQPYLLNGTSASDKAVLGQLSVPNVARDLTSLSLSYGADNVMALAEVTDKLQAYNVGLMGASTSVYANRMSGFVGSVQSYQKALMDYRQALTANAALKNVAKQKAHVVFQKMQLEFGHELKAATAHIKSRKGTPLTSATRGTNIARSSRNVTKLTVMDQVQANKLVKLTRQAKFLGNGLAVIDFGSRVGAVKNSYHAGGNWERDLFIESSSFAASAITGTIAVNVGSAALTFLMMATPVGWVGLVVGGVAVAGIAAGASMGVNGYAKENSGDLYDDIMKWISS